MSSKGRKPVESEEFYPTDRRVVYSLLESDQVSLPGGRWIEPCAGMGKLVEAVNECRQDISWHLCEINYGFDPYLRRILREGDKLHNFGDFVHRQWNEEVADVAILNPPFSLTMQFVVACMERARWVVCLQRQGWFGSQERAPWFREHCPDVYQLPRRPSFRPDGKTDSCEYSWFIFPPEAALIRRSGTIAMLEKPATGQLSLLGREA
jgi:hypothetical protein